MRPRIRLLAAAAAALVMAGVAGSATAAATATPDPGGPTTQIIGGSLVTPQQMRTFYPGVLSFQILHPTRQIPDWPVCTGTALAPPPRRTKGTPPELAADAALDRQAREQSARLGGPATRWVWLNAHCFTNPDGSAWDVVAFDMHVRIGSVDRTSGGRVIDVVQAIPHEGWAWGTVPGAAVNDGGLLVLNQWVLAGATLAPSPGKEGPAKTAGWGLLQPDGTELPTRLHQMDLTAPFNPLQCTGVGLPLAPNEVCTESAVATGPCNGDSGGPLTKKGVNGAWQLVGSASRSGAGDACGSGGDIYTDATAYASWIRYVMAHGRTPTPAPVRTGNLRQTSPLNWTHAPDFTTPAAR